MVDLFILLSVMAMLLVVLFIMKGIEWLLE